MLVLERRPGETICLGSNIRVTILGINSNGKIRIGFEAPDDVKILREEVAQRIRDTGGHHGP